MSAPGIALRQASADDLPAIIALIADDDLARARDGVSAMVTQSLLDAFAAIERDDNQFFAVALEGAAIVGCFHLTFIPGLSRDGAWRGQIETVRVASVARGRGVGRIMMEWAIAECRRRGCALVQLTTDKRRSEAHRFYARLGFTATHEGMKLSFG